MPGIRGDAKLAWQTVDVTAFKGPTQKAWDAYKAASEDAKEYADKNVTPKRIAFESLILADAKAQELLGADETLQYAYRFGGFAVAVVAAAAPGKSKLMLGASTLIPKAVEGAGHVPANPKMRQR